jgi:acetyl/propionyl-CoA carboxylase alpha subunit
MEIFNIEDEEKVEHIPTQKDEKQLLANDKLDKLEKLERINKIISKKSNVNNEYDPILKNIIEWDEDRKSKKCSNGSKYGIFTCRTSKDTYSYLVMNISSDSVTIGDYDVSLLPTSSSYKIYDYLTQFKSMNIEFKYETGLDKIGTIVNLLTCKCKSQIKFDDFRLEIHPKISTFHVISTKKGTITIEK